MLISLIEYAKMHGKNRRTVRDMAARGGFMTARKVSRIWLIDSDEQYPPDRRIKSGNYIDWRKKMRKSLIDIKHMVSERPYPGMLPDELKPYHAYISDSGHSLMCIPAKVEKDAFDSSEPWGYELPLPVKYVLEKGYEKRDDYLIVDVPYDENIGAVVYDRYYEF